MKIITVRHGESELNVSDLVQGNLNASDLTARGREQAQALADRLAKEQIDLAYVSPLRRAKQTADIVLNYHPNTKVILNDQLIERDFGKYQGGPRDDFYADFNASGLNYVNFKPEGGETWHEGGKRVADFIKNEIVAKHQSTNDTILIVGHGSTLTYFLMLMNDQPIESANSKEQYDKYRPANTAMSVIEIDANGHPRVGLLNDVSHLSIPPAQV